jgi:aspartate-semialdehyde dehydrogenase
MPASGAPAKRIPVAVLGATGAVGQTFIRLLKDHPWLELRELAASDRSAGKSYREATRWLDGALDEGTGARKVVGCDPAVVESTIVFSALDSSVAGDIEQRFAQAGKLVLSNARNFRMAADVPLIIPEINPDHLALLPAQRKARGWNGAIVTNANCAAIVASMALAPLHQRFGVREVALMTMQAVSGAGYPGVASLDILGNVIPYIGDEEGKLESEPQKILGTMNGDAVSLAPIAISAHANRVAVEHGHTVCMSIRLANKASEGDVRASLGEWRGAEIARTLHSAPDRALLYTELPDRPQPRRDVGTGKGMTVIAGRLRADSLFDFKLVAMGHNTIRGAAGASILNAELMIATGLVGHA